VHVFPGVAFSDLGNRWRSLVGANSSPTCFTSVACNLFCPGFCSPHDQTARAEGKNDRLHTSLAAFSSREENSKTLFAGISKTMEKSLIFESLLLKLWAACNKRSQRPFSIDDVKAADAAQIELDNFLGEHDGKVSKAYDG
jgi:hypothetical protein